MTVIKEFYVDKLETTVFDDRCEMGAAAAIDIEKRVVELLLEKEFVTIVFAAAPSQLEVLEALRNSSVVDWSRVVALHMDEYVGLAVDAPQRFGNFLKEQIFKSVPQCRVHYIDSFSVGYEGECERYASLLNEYKPDITILGVGENGHIAFNDPPVADFDDPSLVKIVELDHLCRQQQVNDGCFETIEDVPTHAITLTIPALLMSESLFCVVPHIRKAEAIERMLNGSIATECPASILRTVEGVKLYLDKDSASGIL